MTALSAREAYRLWAPHYEAETAISFLEDRVVRSLGVPTAGRSLVDVGCGTGRRLRETDAAIAIGVDVSLEMLSLANVHPVAAADVLLLPFADATFDLVWCRLMIGHVRDVTGAYAELGRVCRAGGTVVVSDICPEAVAAGHRRTFRADDGTVREIEHFVHSLEQHGATGLKLLECVDGCVGPEIEAFYARAGRGDSYQRQLGTPLVRVFVWRAGARSEASDQTYGVRPATDAHEGGVGP